MLSLPGSAARSKGAESSYGVLMERFVAAVEEDYADTDFLVRPWHAGSHSTVREAAVPPRCGCTQVTADIAVAGAKSVVHRRGPQLRIWRQQRQGQLQGQQSGPC